MGEDKIVASVGGKPITEADVSREIARMGQRGQSYNTPQGRAMVLEQLINKRLFLLDAQRNLYEREPAFKEQLQAIKEEMLTSYAVQKAVERVRVTEEEVKNLGVEKHEVVVSYNVGDSVKITDGALESFIGTVEEIDMDHSKVRVVVSMFGRETPVELELDQVELLDN